MLFAARRFLLMRGRSATAAAAAYDRTAAAVSGKRGSRATAAAAVAAAYLPVLASSPGLVGADTKSYLYLDPGRLMSRAASLWEADRALGTVTHQNIGFLWPMGPFYWVFDALGVPDWVAQRLWIGTVIAAAGLGVLYLLRTLGFSGRGTAVAVLAYELSPYLLHYSARISAVLLPWAGLGWLLGLTVRAARTGGWRHPALFALTVVTVGSVNATGLVLAGLAPVLWLVHAAAVDRGVSPRAALGTAARIGALSLGVSLWWATALAVQGAFSLPVTRYTETYEVIAAASTAPEVLRGLGYWFFYGNDKFGPWIEPSVYYTQGGWLIFVGFGLAVLALGSAAAVRWRHRGFFVLLAAVGALVAVGAHPTAAPSLLGGLFERFVRTDAGLAMRSLPRAGPLVALALSVLLGAGVNALARRARRIGALAGVVVLAAVLLNNPAMWRLRMIEDGLSRGEHLPDYWHEAAAALDADRGDGSQASRVWEVPGSDFASYRWGNTVDPITPGLTDRGYVARELVPFGSPQSAALLGAVDRRLQEGTIDADSLAPIARLMSAGNVVHRADLSFERFRTPRPVETAELLDRTPGLRRTAAFGPAVPNVAGPQQTLIDEIHLARPVDPAHPAPVTVYEVSDPLPILRTRPVAGATVLAGDADGIVDAAGAGVLDLNRSLVLAADLAADPALAKRVLAEPVHVIVTDTNRRQAQRWGTLRENRGHTEQSEEAPLDYDPTDNRLEVFAAPVDAHPDDARTVSEQRGPVSAQASAHGNPVTYTNDDRAYFAVDGDEQTAWVVAAFAEARGERLRLRLAEPAAVGSLRLLQPSGRDERHVLEAGRRITEVKISVDGRTAAVAELDERSHSEPGQTVPLGRDGMSVTAELIEIEITETDVSRRAVYPGIAPVGFAEADLALGPVTEVIRTPRALTDALGAHIDDHALTVVLTRERSNPREPVRADPETRMLRAVPLPTAREFEVSGAARLSAAAAEPLIDALVAQAPIDAADTTATSSGHLAGDLPSRASAAFDGDPETAWTGVFGPQSGQWIELSASEPFRAEEIEITAVVDARHSTPETVRLFTDGEDRGVFHLELAPALDGEKPGATATATLPLSIESSTVRLVIESARERLTRDWYSNGFVALPVALAEVRLGAAAAPDTAAPEHSPRIASHPGAAHIDTGCRSDLLRVNGEPVAVRVTGAAADGLARRELRMTGCEPVTAAAGELLLEAAPGAETGLDLDQVVLSSPRALTDPQDGIGAVDAVRHSDTRYSVEVPPSEADRWLVLGQSYNRGWRAVAGGADLGVPVVIDGFANGWLLSASADAVSVELRWTPQRSVDWALHISALFAAAAALAALRGRRDRADGLGAGRIGEPSQPALTWHSGTAGGPPRPAPGQLAAGAAAAAAAGVAAVNLPTGRPWHLLAAPALAAAAVAALRLRPARGLLPLLASASLGIAALYVLIQQYRFRYPPDFVWPQQFEAVHILGVLAILCLAADYAVTVTLAGARGAARRRAV